MRSTPGLRAERSHLETLPASALARILQCARNSVIEEREPVDCHFRSSGRVLKPMKSFFFPVRLSSLSSSGCVALVASCVVGSVVGSVACSDAGGGDRSAAGSPSSFGPPTPAYSNPDTTNTPSTTGANTGGTSGTSNTGSEGNPTVNQVAPNLNDTGGA